jgi:hypothetical protein
MIVWAHGDMLHIFTHGPIGKYYNFSTMNLCGPIFSAASEATAEQNARMGPQVGSALRSTSGSGDLLIFYLISGIYN